MAFTWGTSGVKKNFYSIYAKAGGTHAMSGYATVALALAGLVADGFEEIGSCKAEPSIVTSAQDGIENNKGSTIGASKEAAIEVVLMQLTDDNYNSAIALDNEEVTFVYIEENRGITYVLQDLVADVNLNTTGNTHEELPITATKDAATIGASVVRYTIGGASAAVGIITATEITTAGDYYQAADIGLILTQTATSGVGSGATFIITSVDGTDGLESVVMASGGSGYADDDTITLSLGTAAGATPAVITVRGVTA